MDPTWRFITKIQSEVKKRGKKKAPPAKTGGAYEPSGKKFTA